MGFALPEVMRRLLRSRGLRMIVVVCGVGWILVEGLERLGGPEAIRETYGFGTTWLLVPIQAVVAVMRKLLHAIHGMFHSDTVFEGAKFYAQRA